MQALLDLPLPLDDVDGSLCTLLDDVGVTKYLGNISDTRHMYEVKQKVRSSATSHPPPAQPPIHARMLCPPYHLFVPLQLAHKRLLSC